MRLLAAVLALLALAACPRRSGGGSLPRPDRTAPVTAGGPVVWLDCRADSDCAARDGVVCHVDVMGGTCAPPCENDAPCQGIQPGLSCTAGRCTAARPGD
ncbi:MAG: hypothetical protein HY904_18580 [Deltaproteobacteria bacterium]|nr:hypothetical protein [Deltaproteobacteria bacterium]